MSDNWLSPEQREEIRKRSKQDGYLNWHTAETLLDSYASADRIIAESREFEKLAYMLDALTGAPLNAPATEPEHMAEVIPERVAELRADQKRLDWLSERNTIMVHTIRESECAGDFKELLTEVCDQQRKTLREAIDAAMWRES